MSVRLRTVVAAVTVWLAIVVSTSTAAWLVIDRTGRGVYLTDSGPELAAGPSTTRPTSGASTAATSTTSSDASTPSRRPRPSTTTASQGARPSTDPVPPSSPSRPAARPSSTSPQQRPSGPAVVSDSVSVTGGSVGVSCRAATLTLRFATPRNGWTYTLERSSEKVEVEFRANGGEQESRVRARCSDGVPEFEADSSRGDDDG